MAGHGRTHDAETHDPDPLEWCGHLVTALDRLDLLRRVDPAEYTIDPTRVERANERIRMRRINPTSIAGPFATYAHGVEVESQARILFGAGQTGVEPDGRVPETIEEQAAIVWSNMKVILAEADMGIGDIVQLNMLLIDRADRDGAMAVRDEELGPHRPASTLMYISGLANPAWKIEIDFIAAREV
jgi:enamine deaminase RidA (YjgF/YER057c/UK114 family)